MKIYRKYLMSRCEIIEAFITKLVSDEKSGFEEKP